MFKQIERFIKAHNLFSKDSTIVIGLSGGPDSVFLLHFLAALRDRGDIAQLVAAHLDHEWRADSYEDTQFCHEVAKKYNVPLVAKKMSELSISLKFNGSLEEVGRKARQFFFESVKKEYKADLIALAHHAQDQQETFFIRLLRGATLTGLTAMKPKQGCYVRPLLTTNKTDIVDFLDAHSIPYLVDPTNASDKFLRNRVRSQVLPALRTCDARFDKKFEHTLEQLQQTEQFLQQETKNTAAQLFEKKGETIYLPATKLLQLHPVLRDRVLLYWLCQENVQFPVRRGFFYEIIKFLAQPAGGTHKLHHEWQLVKQKGMVRIERLDT